jgi:hypothetical protein
MPQEPSGFEFISNSPDIAFEDVHPTVTAGGKFQGKDLPPYAGSDGAESNYFKCKQCGFIGNRKFNPKGSGWGNETQSDITTISGGTANVKNPITGAGCPLCGSSEYE